MKIDAYRTEQAAEGLDRVAKPTTPVGNRDSVGSAAGTSSKDKVQLSSDAQLMQTVMQGAQQELNIRPDVVERMRAALANGTVGNDPHALADALLDRLIGAAPQKQP